MVISLPLLVFSLFSSGGYSNVKVILPSYFYRSFPAMNSLHSPSSISFLLLISVLVRIGCHFYDYLYDSKEINCHQPRCLNSTFLVFLEGTSPKKVGIYDFPEVLSLSDTSQHEWMVEAFRSELYLLAFRNL